MLASRSGRCGPPALSLILVLGGYGGFGARLSRRLAADGHALLIAGRNEGRAARFAAGLPGAVAVVADRDAPLDDLLAARRPDLLIDAAGPFRPGEHAVPLACARHGVGYLDLADGRAFVTGIGAVGGAKGGAVGEAARAGGVAVIAGASSVPALSGAVVRHLAAGMTVVERVDLSISASNRATAGPSVARAILSYVGRPIRLWRGGRWTRRWGWQSLAREEYAVGGDAIRGRVVALADVPDHDLLVEALPGRPAVTFRAGTELRFQMLALWLLSWPVRWGWTASLDGLTPWLAPLQRLTSPLGGDRSAMRVTVIGHRDGHPIEQRWTLIASDGDGPEIPVLAAQLLARRFAAGALTPGARDAGALLTLADFAPLFDALSIRHDTAERPCPPPLYARILRDRFDRLPPVLRAIHGFGGDGGARGQAEVERGRHPLARLIAALFGFPPSGMHALHVSFRIDQGRERWTRDFSGSCFSSELSRSGDRLVERFGLLRFRFDLPADEAGLRMVLHGWSAAHVPLPLFLAPRIAAAEWQEGDDFRFDVALALPLIGPIVRYRGALRPIR